jgi:hypothetical protein
LAAPNKRAGKSSNNWSLVLLQLETHLIVTSLPNSHRCG